MSQTQEIKERLDIVEIVGERVSLQRSGKNFRGLCPFHSEKSPSFFVSPDLQTYKCFGCGKQGDVFTFIQEFDRLTFRETLELLAKRAGVELTTEIFDPQELRRKRVLELLDTAQKFYHFLLTEHEIGEPGRQYLEKRQTTSATVKLYGLGFAPDGWDHLIDYLVTKKKFTLDEIIDAGLGIEGRKGVYDRFRNRLMFPLHDHRGRVVGFSGRTLAADVKEAKYINTPETLVYHKRDLLFGYHQNLNTIREKESAIIMEGEFDVLSSWQAHVKNVVAIKGSALTKEQVQLLARTVKTIYLSLDADSAGVEATKRAIETIQGFNVALRVILVEGGKDPDELARANPAAWRETVKNHVAAFDYVLEQVCKKQDLSSVSGHRAVADELLSLILKVEHPVERNFYLQKLGEKLDLPAHVMEEQLQRLEKQLTLKLAKRADRDEDVEPATTTADQLEISVWQLAWQHPDPTAAMKKVLTLPFQDDLLKKLQGLVAIYLQHNVQFEVAKFVRQVPAELQDLLTKLYVVEQPYDAKDLLKAWKDIVTRIEARSLHAKRSDINARLAALDKVETLTPEQEEEKQQLLQEFMRLTTKK